MQIDIPANLDLILKSLDLTGTLVFAISGAMAASAKKLDLFGAAFIAFVTALGGGTIRDLLLGATPVGWMEDPVYILVILIGVGLTFLFKKQVQKLRKTLFLFDTIGIAVFTVLGLEKALLIDLSPVIAAIMGMFSAVLGGVIRDTLINEIPLIFRKEIYALACLIGASIFLFLDQNGVGFPLNTLITSLSIISIRIVAIKYKIGLPGIEDDSVISKRFKK